MNAQSGATEVRWDRVTGEPAAFGELVRRVRIAAKLSQEALAERTGLSVRAISDIERGRTARPHRVSVLQIAEALRLTGPALAEPITASGQPVSTARGSSPPAPGQGQQAGPGES
jgi:transcriptional regulator with XRE-family HTH domain